ncbi:hypothetical protein BU26DRAFT_521683 [Trematosphaeria pertusa]|uniref:SRR1-like domain-containing protein n=1 Tax=Trematosphaeria pertusa TaxID=390896 RepID=A0A6A6I9N7_9PLEO|nr:uncharacterized protein BU26DRAFT_521683 [Trematosphaeria pertusa]KAF2246230.1 hypothetical protein BU26DRAFT_521683 [Trematosphaeria pertusa]
MTSHTAPETALETASDSGTDLYLSAPPSPPYLKLDAQDGKWIINNETSMTKTDTWGVKHFEFGREQYLNVKDTGGEFTAPDIYGKLHTCTVEPPSIQEYEGKDQLCGPSLYLRPHLDLMWPPVETKLRDKWGVYPGDAGCLIWIRRRDIIDDSKEALHEFCKNLDHAGSQVFVDSAQLWNSGGEALEKNLADDAVKVPGIDKIVCIGMGALKRVDWFLQHVSVSRIRKILADKQGKAITAIPIYAQDPYYCRKCKAILREMDFEIVEDPDGFMKIDNNTFVISIHPSVPVRQIAVWRTREGGPAGMLCNRIYDEEVVEQKEKRKRDAGAHFLCEYKTRCTTLPWNDVDSPPESRAFSHSEMYIRNTTK